MKVAQEKLENYFKNKVLPRLTLTGTSFSIEPHDLGNRNTVYMINFDGGAGAVLKGHRKKRRLLNCLVANRFLARYDIAVPRTLFSDTSKRTFNSLGYFFSLEEKISGSSLAEAGDISTLIPAVAAFYAELHALRCSRWGKLRSGRKYGFGKYLQRLIAKRLDRLTEAGMLSPAEAAACRGWFSQKLSTIAAARHYSLSHGDVNLKNILIDTQQRVHLIDSEAIKYLPFPMELLRLELVLCGDDRQAAERFEDAYFAACPSRRRQEFEHCQLFYRAYVLLEFAAYNCRKLKKTAEENMRRQFQADASKAINALRQFIK